MEILNFNSNSLKHVDLQNVLEKPVSNFNIKGRTFVAPIFDISSQMSFSNETNRYILNGNILSYTPKVGDGTGNMHPIRFPRKILENNKTYTLSYRVLYSDKDYVKLTKWSQGEGIKELDISEGFHHYTFTTGTFTDNYFLYTNLKKAITESKEVLVIEIFGITEGDSVLKNSVTSGLIPVGLEGKGINIIAQTQNPVLGEYILQGDILSYIENIENKIVNNEETFDIN